MRLTDIIHAKRVNNPGNETMRRIWFAYGDLGYDDANGKRARIVMDNLAIVIKFFEARLGVKIDEQNIKENS